MSDIKNSPSNLQRQPLISEHWDITEFSILLTMLGILFVSLFACFVCLDGFFYYYFALFPFSTGYKMDGWCSGSLFLKSYCQILVQKRHTAANEFSPIVV